MERRNASRPAADAISQPKCSKCNSPPVAYLSYQQMHYCKKHFLLQFEKRVKRTVRDFSLLKKGERVAVGLSGGKDSSVLLHMLCKLQKSLPFEINAILIDEGIESYRPNTIPVAKEECEKLGVPLTIVKFDSKFAAMDKIIRARESGEKGGDAGGNAGAMGNGEHMRGAIGNAGGGGSSIGSAMGKAGYAREAGSDSGGGSNAAKKANHARGACTYCGVFRRYLLNRACKEIGANKLAIGHNLDDMAQTVLMNLMRNEPGRLARFGMAGGLVEDSGFVPRIKPLAQIPEREIALYAALTGIPIHYQECPYAHEALRQQVRKMLNSLEEKYPGTKQRIFNSFLSMQESLSASMREKSIPAPNRCKECGEPTSSELCMACSLGGEIEASFINARTKSS